METMERTGVDTLHSDNDESEKIVNDCISSAASASPSADIQEAVHMLSDRDQKFVDVFTNKIADMIHDKYKLNVLDKVWSG